MSYGNVYVARVAMGAKVNQVLHAFNEADAYPGSSMIITYSPCIAHGYDLRFGAERRATLKGLSGSQGLVPVEWR